MVHRTWFRSFALLSLVSLLIGCGKRSSGVQEAPRPPAQDASAVARETPVEEEQVPPAETPSTSPLCQNLVQGISERMSAAGITDEVLTAVITFEPEQKLLDRLAKTGDTELSACTARVVGSAVTAVASPEVPLDPDKRLKALREVLIGSMGAIGKESKESSPEVFELLSTRFVEAAFTAVQESFAKEQQPAALAVAYVAVTENLSLLSDDKNTLESVGATLKAVALGRLMAIPDLDLDAVLERIAAEKASPGGG